jgi:L-seryl-tRNA(Ser) seleniumtransferase
VVVTDVDPIVVGRTATDIVRDLRRENPRVFVGADELDAGEFSINPMCLTDEEADYMVQRVLARVEGSDD